MDDPTKRSSVVRAGLVLCLLALLLTAVWPASAQEPSPSSGQGEFKAGELLVRLQANLPTAVAQGLQAEYNAELIRPLLLDGVELWAVPEGQELDIARRLEAHPAVVYAEPNHVYRALTTPNDPSFPNQWGHTLMQSPAAWSLSTGSTGVTVAIIDTGIDETHPDLSGKIVAGYDFVGNDANPHDGNGHGTHCAGIAAAVTNNGVGVAGMDWLARIMPIRALDDSGSGYDSDITDGIVWAYTHGAKVISLSLGGPTWSATQQAAVNDAHAAGSLVVAAMGNDNTSTPSYPAAYNNVLAVAATGPSDGKASYSNYGAHCDIAAPGGDMSYLHDPAGIYSTMPTYPCFLTTNYGYSEDYDFLNGTSQATPYVSGLAALIWSLDGTLTPDEVQTIIESSAVDLGALGWDQYFGHGRINAFAALSAVTPPAYDNWAYLPIIRKSGSAPPPGIPNGDFESGPVAWTEYSSHGWDIIMNGGWPGTVTPHGGSWAAWLGGEYDDISYLQQQVTVPAGSHYLAYYHWIASADECNWDWAYVRVNGLPVHSYTLCEATSTGGWVRRTVNLAGYSGQSINLQIRVETDSSLNSNLFVDDVSWASSVAGEPEAPDTVDPASTTPRAGRH